MRLLMVTPIRSFPQLAEQMRNDLKQTWIGKHVAWLKEPTQGAAKVFEALLKIYRNFPAIGHPGWHSGGH